MTIILQKQSLELVTIVTVVNVVLGRFSLEDLALVTVRLDVFDYK